MHLGSQMAHNVCCDSYHVYNVTYLLQNCTHIGVKYVTCVSVLFPETVFTDWAPGCYVRCGCIGSPVFSFPVNGMSHL